MKINYDPWDKRYKKTFGALKANQEISFAIDIKEIMPQQVQLYLVEDYTQNKIVKQLTWDNQRQLFTTKLKLASGLYFYYFIIEYRDENGVKQIYYGRNQINNDFNNISKFQLTVFERQVASFPWYQRGICYQIFPDSFARDLGGSSFNLKENALLYDNQSDLPLYVKDQNGNILRWTFYGGNLEGIIQKIPYLKSLGVTCVYLNPIFQATSSHRYDTDDYFKIDDFLGNERIFKKLVQKLHQNGMYLILDGVFDHVGANSRYFNQNKKYGEDIGATQNQQGRYYPWFTFSHYPDKYECWWGAKDLPQIKKGNLDFHNFIAGEHGVINYWTKRGVDGWRLDVADELSDDLIKDIKTRLNHFNQRILIGEVWEDSSNKISYGHRRKYVLGEQLDGSMNYPLRTGILELINQTQVQKVALDWMHLYENYPQDYLLNCLNNIGTHDTQRILTALGEDVTKLKLAVGLLFMFPGVPCIYYGDEVGMCGQKDPDNRRFYPWGNENWQIYRIYSKWIKRRQRLLALQTGQMTLFAWGDAFGIARFQNNEPCVIYLINCSNYSLQLDASQLKIYHDELNLKKYLLTKYADQQLGGYAEKYEEIDLEKLSD